MLIMARAVVVKFAHNGVVVAGNQHSSCDVCKRTPNSLRCGLIFEKKQSWRSLDGGYVARRRILDWTDEDLIS